MMDELRRKSVTQQYEYESLKHLKTAEYEKRKLESQAKWLLSLSQLKEAEQMSKEFNQTQMDLVSPTAFCQD